MKHSIIALILASALGLWSCTTSNPPRSSGGYPLRAGTYEYLEGIKSGSFAGLYLSTLFDLRGIKTGERKDYRVLQLDIAPFESDLERLGNAADRMTLAGASRDQSYEAYSALYDKYEAALAATENGEQFEVSDYDNVLRHPGRITLKDQMKLLPAKNAAGADFSAVEKKLTEILELVRTKLIAQMDEANMALDKRADLQPISVRIGGEGFNPTVSRGDRVIELSPDLLRDMFARSVFRASVVLARDETPLTMLDCDDCVDFPAILPRFAMTMFQLPAIYQPHFRSEALAEGLRQIPPANLTPDEAEHVERLLAALTCPEELRDWQFPDGFGGEQQDPCERYVDAFGALTPIATPEEGDDSSLDAVIRTLNDLGVLLKTKNPNAARDHAFNLYLADMRTFLAQLDADDVPNPMGLMQGYMRYFAELMLETQVVEMEMQKAALFLLSHEAYHAWFDSTPLNQTEFDADSFAVQAYNRAFPELNLDAFMEGKKPDAPSMLEMEGGGAEDAFRTLIFGRAPDFIFADTYRGTPYFLGNPSHPSFDQRLYRIRAQIDLNTGQITQQFNERFECLFGAETSAEAEACAQQSGSTPP